MGLIQLDSYVLLLSGNDCIKFVDGLSTNKVTGTCTTVFTDQNAKIIDMVDVIEVGQQIALVGFANYKEKLLRQLTSKILQQDVAIRDITPNNKVYLSTEHFPPADGITVVPTFRGWLIVASSSIQIDITLTLEEFNEYRVNNMIPHQGHEIVPNVHPFNCGLEHLVHEAKGCYIGQEILTRMRSRGFHGKKLMRRNNPAEHVTTQGYSQSLCIDRLEDEEQQS